MLWIGVVVVRSSCAYISIFPFESRAALGHIAIACGRVWAPVWIGSFVVFVGVWRRSTAHLIFYILLGHELLHCMSTLSLLQPEAPLCPTPAVLSAPLNLQTATRIFFKVPL